MGTYPVRVSARSDAPSRWLWLVKWLLLIPHYLVLFVLWTAFVVLTIVAYVAVLFTGRYPHSIFGFNVGVLRWTWRVGYYGYWVLGTDRYPPFTLHDVPDYPARLQIDGPPRPRRWLPLVAWLFALPHIALVSVLFGGGSAVSYQSNGTTVTDVSGGVVSLAVLVVAIALLFTGRHLSGLHDLLVGFGRWSLRTIAYVALLTDVYPPFRLDQGGNEPTGPTGWPSAQATTAAPAGWAAPEKGAPAVAPGPRPAGASLVGRAVALVAGVLLLFAGTGTAIGGAAALGLSSSRDGDGYIASTRLSLASATAAITAEGIEVHPGDAFGRRVSGLDAVRITASSPSGTPLFLGVALESDVDAWLRGTAHDEVREIYGARADVRYDRSPGGLRAVSTPGDRPFWLTTASGTGTVRLDWTPGDGRFAVVLARADGAPGVAAETTVAAKIPALRLVGTGLLAGGLVAVLLAAALVYFGATGLAAASRGGGPTGGGPTGPPAAAPPAPPGPPMVFTGSGSRA